MYSLDAIKRMNAPKVKKYKLSTGRTITADVLADYFISRNGGGYTTSGTTIAMAEQAKAIRTGKFTTQSGDTIHIEECASK